MTRILCIGIVLAATLAAVAQAKSGRTYYTPERLQAAKDNLAASDWARKELEQILRAGPVSPQSGVTAEAYLSAERMAALSDEDLFALMPPVTVGRRTESPDTTLCPVHGAQIRRESGHRPWKIDDDKHPWKVICPVGGEMYPSNDFAAGDLTSGPYADNGDGAVVNGKRYEFIRYYAHHAYLHRVIPALRSLAAAYLLTGETRYGEKCAVLMAALAANFPGPRFHSAHCYGGDYKRRSGMVTDYIWECITMEPLALAYDAIWPVYEQSPQVLAFLKRKGLPAGSPQEAREFVEDRIFRQAMQALRDEAISGNPGHHQLAAITLALVMDDFDPRRRPNSRDMVEFVYDAGYAPTRWVMNNFLTRDGGGYEGPGYDRIKFNYVEVALRMEEVRARRPALLPVERFPRILEEPKAKAMYDFFIEITSLGFFTPEVGDTGGARLSPGFIPPRYFASYPRFYADGFRIYRDPRYASALLGPEGVMRDGNLFEPSIEAEVRAAAQTPEAQIALGTRLLDDYGFGFLSGGKGRSAAEALINYSALKGHYQDDFLALYLNAHEMAILPDLGYPFTWDYRQTWDSNIYTHNTVAVDGAPPLSPAVLPRGWTSLLGARDGVSAAVIAHDCYNPRYNYSPFGGKAAPFAEKHPPVNRYERIVVMVDAEDDTYLLDLFVVEGGLRHDQSWHSVLRDAQLPPLDWQRQDQGTAAGASVAFNTSYINPRGREVKDGLCFVTNVQRATTSAPAAFHWDYRLSEPAGLRLHVVPVDGPVQLIYGTGRSPARPETWNLPLLFVRREGPEGLISRFLTVLEPYRGTNEPRIASVRAEGASWPLTVRVTRGDIEDEITLHAPSPGGALERGNPRDLGVRVVTRRGDEVLRRVRFGALPDAKDGMVRGKITALDRAAQTITLDLPPQALAGTTPWVRIHSPGRSSMYRVLKTEADGADRTRLTLKETSLLSRVLPVEYKDGRIINGAPIPFATGSVNAKGEYVAGTCRFAGARLESESGRVSLRLAGVNGSGWINAQSGYDLYLENPLSAARLKAMFAPSRRLLAIHDYGIGDAVEFVRAASQ